MFRFAYALVFKQAGERRLRRVARLGSLAKGIVAFTSRHFQCSLDLACDEEVSSAARESKVLIVPCQ